VNDQFDSVWVEIAQAIDHAVNALLRLAVAVYEVFLFARYLSVSTAQLIVLGLQLSAGRDQAINLSRQAIDLALQSSFFLGTHHCARFVG
jgi:hypothetical protein